MKKLKYWLPFKSIGKKATGEKATGEKATSSPVFALSAEQIGELPPRKSEDLNEWDRMILVERVKKLSSIRAFLERSRIEIDHQIATDRAAAWNWLKREERDLQKELIANIAEAERSGWTSANKKEAENGSQDNSGE